MKNRRKRNQQPCSTYYGSHGCDKRKDHPGDHECGCGISWTPDDPHAFSTPPYTPPC